MRKERGKQRMGKNEEVARKSYSTKEKYKKKNSFFTFKNQQQQPIRALVSSPTDPNLQ